ncbi:MAG: serine/threonine protein kinase [Polyangiaceae bacterium]|nr:serine/threonine protein kinase [Polyangiaceae bacterium]
MKTISEGQTIGGKYILQHELGRGGQSSVWEAHDKVLDRAIALKLMSPELLESPEARARFEREARAAARISSPHVVQIYDFGVDDGTPYIGMELLHGEDLNAWLTRQGRLTLSETATLISRIARALEVVHHAKVVHRDLKPANIFLAKQGGEEVLKLVDFGIAKAREGVDARTSTSAIVGTVYYMSPEQIRREAIDHRSDLWSLGVIAYQALTGTFPFQAESAFDIMDLICKGTAPRATAAVAGLPIEVDDFFYSVWQKDPQKRPSSATELARRLDEIARAALPPPPPHLPIGGGDIPKPPLVRKAVVTQPHSAPNSVPQPDLLSPLGKGDTEVLVEPKRPVTVDKWEKGPPKVGTVKDDSAVAKTGPGNADRHEETRRHEARPNLPIGTSRRSWAIVGALALTLASIPIVIFLWPDNDNHNEKPGSGSGSSGVEPIPTPHPIPSETRTRPTVAQCPLSPWDGKVRAFGKVTYADCQKADAIHGYFLRVSWKDNQAVGRNKTAQAWAEYLAQDLGNAACPEARELFFFPGKGDAGAGIYFPTKPPGWDSVATRHEDWLLQDARNERMREKVCFFTVEEGRIPADWAAP